MGDLLGKILTEMQNGLGRWMIKLKKKTASGCNEMQKGVKAESLSHSI